MNVFVKILLTLVIMAIFTFVGQMIIQAMTPGSAGMRICALLLLVAFVGSLIAVWKKKKNDTEPN